MNRNIIKREDVPCGTIWSLAAYFGKLGRLLLRNRTAAKLSAIGPDDQEAGTSDNGHYLFQVEEAERRRIGRELHDETAQGLTVVRFHLEMLQGMPTSPDVQKTLGEAMAAVDRTIEGLRRIVARLSPQALEKMGLIGVIRKEARDFASVGVQVNVKISARFGRLSPAIELALYRLVQEALHNIAKHAQAKTVEIDLSREGDKVRLLITDDGVGFGGQTNFHQHAYGVFGMRERIRSLGGTFRIRSRADRGTRIQVSISPPPCSTESPVAPPRLLSSRECRQERASGR